MFYLISELLFIILLFGFRKMRWLDNYLYSGGSRGHSAAPQKKYQLYGRRLTDPVSGTYNYKISIINLTMLKCVQMH